MALASNLPDIDAIVYLAGSADWVLMRRTFGHSLLLIPLWAAGLTWLLKRYGFRNIRVGTLYGMCLLGALVHIFFDLINSFGVVPLWPLSSWRPELSIIFIIDLILTGLLAAPLVIAAVGFRRELTALSTWALGLTAVYFMLCGSARSMALVRLSEEAFHLGVRPDFLYVFPEPFGPHRWRGVLRAGDIYRVYLMRPFSGTAQAVGENETMPENPRVRLVRETPLGRRLDWFFKAPVWSVKGSPDGTWEVSAHDLRFKSLLMDMGTHERPPFAFKFLVEPNGTIERL